MRKHLAASNRWTWCSAALCLAAAVFWGWQLWRNDEVAAVPPVQSADETLQTEDERQVASFKIPAAEEYEEIVMRPLFIRSRRPESPQQASQANSGDSESKGTPAAHISLNGVVVARASRSCASTMIQK